MSTANEKLKKYCKKVLFFLSKIVNDENGQISINKIDKDEYEKMMIMKDILMKHIENANINVNGHLEKIAKMKPQHRINLIKRFYSGKKDAIQNIINLSHVVSSKKTIKSRKPLSKRTISNREGGSPARNIPIANIVVDAVQVVDAEAVIQCELCDEDLDAFVGEEDDETGESMDPHILHSFGGVDHVFHLSCLVRRHGYNHNGCVQCTTCHTWCAFPNDLGIACDQTGNIVNETQTGNDMENVAAGTVVLFLLHDAAYVLFGFLPIGRR
jgi:dsDNA-binding SOS-regulon protein